MTPSLSRQYPRGGNRQTRAHGQSARTTKGRGVYVSRFSGKQGKHAMRKVREQKRLEAEGRNAETPVERRRWYRIRTAEMRAKGWDV